MGWVAAFAFYGSISMSLGFELRYYELNRATKVLVYTLNFLFLWSMIMKMKKTS